MSETWVGAALDTETSGLDPARDQVIEIGIQMFRFDASSGRGMERLESYSALQDPGFSISMEIQGVTGISNEMLKGQAIDWTRVDALLSRADLILAHNAAFDRGFLDRKSGVSPEKLWGCTSMQVDWRGKGFKNARLQDLCGALGISYDPHRAMSDVTAMLRLIESEDVFTGQPYLAELLSATRQEMAWIWLEGDTYSQKEQLKGFGFRWNGALKTWGKLVLASDQKIQTDLIQAAFPAFKVQSRVVPPRERFKSV